MGSKDFQVLDQTMGQLLEKSSETFSDKTLIHAVEQNVRVTYGEAFRKVDRLAAGLLSLGLQKGERVAIWAPNSWEWLIVQYAVARAGLIAVAMNPMSVGAEAMHCLSLTKVAAVIAPSQNKNIRHLEILEQLAPELREDKPGSAKCSKLPHLKAAICMNGNPPKFAVHIDELCSSSTESDLKSIKNMQAEISADDAVLLQFSSGTTGKPKAVVISHKSYTTNGKVIAQGLRHNKDKPVVFCVQVPLFHAFGLVAVANCTLHLGGKVVLPSVNYSPIANLNAVKEQKCTVLTGTPTMYLDMIRQTEKEGKPTNSPEVAICGGAPLVPQLGKDILEILKVKKICAIYGLSEITAAGFLSAQDDTFEHMCHTVGKVTPMVEAKVVDESGNVVPVNTPGEVWFRGYSIMKGYFEQEDATRECTSDGWFKTGDQFVITEDGHGKVIGRFKDIIIRGGENISPKEVEEILTAHPDIIDAQVIGVKDERLGEEICACVLAREPITGKLITDICKDKVAYFKIPKYYVVMDGYPRTTSGKIQKHKLRDICNKLLDDDKLLPVNSQNQ